MAMKKNALLVQFDNERFGNIRGLLIDGEPWFVGKDVAIALGYEDTFAALKQHVDNEDKRVFTAKTLRQMASNQEAAAFGVGSPMRGTQRLTFINEAGLYSLTFSSQMPQAREFKRWVTHEVLPAIRRSGMYTPAQLIEQLFKSAEFAQFAPKCVYILELNNGTVKIGCTQDFWRRLRQIELASGLSAIRGGQTEKFQPDEAFALEKACHELLANNRIQGEFFDTTFTDTAKNCQLLFNGELQELLEQAAAL